MRAAESAALALIERVRRGQGDPPTAPQSDRSGLDAKAKGRLEADDAHRKAVADWRERGAAALWVWDRLVLQAATSAADVLALEAAALDAVALAWLRRSVTAP